MVISPVRQLSNFPSFESYRFWNYSGFVIIDAYWFDQSICTTVYMFTYIKEYKKLDRETILVARLTFGDTDTASLVCYIYGSQIGRLFSTQIAGVFIPRTALFSKYPKER